MTLLILVPPKKIKKKIMNVLKKVTPIISWSKDTREIRIFEIFLSFFHKFFVTLLRIDALIMELIARQSLTVNNTK